MDAYRTRLPGPYRGPRLDPVVWGGASGPLTPGQLERFEQDGYLLLHSLAREGEVQALRDRIARGVDALGVEDEVVLEPDSDRVRSLFAVHRFVPEVLDWYRDLDVVDMARQILGGPIYVHQSRVNFKPAFGGRPFHWHSDFETWHAEDGLPRMRALSAVLFLTEATPFNGPLQVVPGSHRSFLGTERPTPPRHHEVSLRRQEVGVPPEGPLRELIDAGGMASVVGPAGSVLLFDCNLLHASSGNLSPWSRDQVFLVFNSVDNAPTMPFGGTAPRPEHIAARRVEPLA